MIVTHNGDNHNYLVQTLDCNPQWRQSQLPSTDTSLYHTVDTIPTTKYRHVIVPHSGDNHN